MGKPDGWAKAWGLAAHVEPAGCMTCGVRSARGPQDVSEQIAPQGYGATNPYPTHIGFPVGTGEEKGAPHAAPVFRISVEGVGFFGIPQGSRVYKGVLQDGQWVKGRDVTLPGQWNGPSWVIPADANQRSGTQVYVVAPPVGPDWTVQADPASVGRDGIIFVDANQQAAFRLRRRSEGNGFQFGNDIDEGQPHWVGENPIPAASKSFYKSSQGPQMDYSKQIAPQGYGATNPLVQGAPHSMLPLEAHGVTNGITGVGFFGIPAGSRVYKGVLQDGVWVPGRDVTLPGQWQGQSWVIPADANQRSGAQVYVIDPPRGPRWSVQVNARDVGPDGVIFVQQPFYTLGRIQLNDEYNPIPSVSKSYK